MSQPQSGTDGQTGAFFSKAVIGGVPWAVFGKVILFFVYFAIPIIIVRNLGPDKYGMFSLCKNIGEFLILFCSLGLNTALIRFIPELCATQNRAGLVRLLGKTAAIQAGAVVIAGCAMMVAKTRFDALFNVDFRYYLLLSALLVGVRVFRQLIDDTYMAFFLVRTTSILSIIQGLLSLALVALLLPRMPEVPIALMAQAIPVALVSAAGVFFLARFVRQLKWRSPLRGIGRRRTLGIALPSLANALALVILAQYSEMFFLGYFFTPAIVGIYDVGCGFSLMFVTFIPMAIYKLFTSGFAEAYARDDKCLDNLVESFYKALIVIVLPMSVFGVFFGPRAIELLYGPEMKAAGWVAAVFFIYHTLALMWTPLSMAITAKEKVLHTQPLMVLQLAVNLPLDYLLIPRFQVYGALAAVIGTWILTTPVQLYVISRLVGGIHFPTWFFVRITVVLLGLAALMSPLAPHVNLAGLCLVGLIYTSVCLAANRLFHLVRHEDTLDLRNLGFGKLNKALDWFVGGQPQRKEQ